MIFTKSSAFIPANYRFASILLVRILVMTDRSSSDTTFNAVLSTALGYSNLSLYLYFGFYFKLIFYLTLYKGLYSFRYLSFSMISSTVFYFSLSSSEIDDVFLFRLG